MAINKSYTFTNNTIIDPAEVNQNFDDVIAAIKAAHHQDADGTPIDPADIVSGWGLVPSGGIILWSGLISAIPAGYVFCNGASSTPDMRGLFALCPGQDSGGTYDTGDTGGEATHVLTTAEMPAHTHPQSWAPSNNSGTGGGGPDAGSVATGSTGGGGAHNNMPPFKALVYMMKT
ncbi:MAG: hypothetical protein WA082_04480 [Candidatus Moraniibacteriota bacterium]